MEHYSLDGFRKSLSPNELSKFNGGDEKERSKLLEKHIRDILNFTKEKVDKDLSLSEANISSFENKDDELSFSALVHYVRAIGGTVEINIKLPDGRLMTYKY